MASVRGCARCGGDHDDLVWKLLTRPIPENDGSALWTHWCLCPATGEPILQAEVPLSVAEEYGLKRTD